MKPIVSVGEVSTKGGQMPKEEPVTLYNLVGGAVAEHFDEELSRVVSNILDPNTDPEAVREINLKLRIKPGNDRRIGAVSIQVTSKTGPIQGLGTMFYFGKHGGRCFAVENNPNQPSLFDEPAKPTAVNFQTGEVADGD
jgi:hypothetical protein